MYELTEPILTECPAYDRDTVNNALSEYCTADAIKAQNTGSAKRDILAGIRKAAILMILSESGKPTVRIFGELELALIHSH